MIRVLLLGCCFLVGCGTGVAGNLGTSTATSVATGNVVSNCSTSFYDETCPIGFDPPSGFTQISTKDGSTLGTWVNGNAVFVILSCAQMDPRGFEYSVEWFAANLPWTLVNKEYSTAFGNRQMAGLEFTTNTDIPESVLVVYVEGNNNSLVGYLILGVPANVMAVQDAYLASFDSLCFD